MRFSTARPICSCLAAILYCLTAPCLADSAPATQTGTNLTAPAILHTVECPNPKREVCVIKKPVGSGYRLLTQGITLEDSGEYWLADFTRQQPKGKQPEPGSLSFRVMGKDNDIHRIEISFATENSTRAKADAAKTSSAAGKGKSVRKGKAE